MRFLNEAIINAADETISETSAAQDVSQVISLSVQAVFNNGGSSGTLKLQASNDHNQAGNIPGFTPTNWTDISGASAVVAGGASVLISLTSVQYQWIRAVWTPTGGAGTITVTMKTVGY